MDSRGAAEHAFTAYLRSLDPSGEPPDSASFERVWQALRRALRGELRRRGMWDSPPAYLGVYGWQFWEDPGRSQDFPATSASAGDALDELVADCYAYNFVTRLRSLRSQLAVKPQIEGLIYRNVRNLLHDLQKKHDPLGFRVFEVVRRALRHSIRASELFVVGGDPKINNDTVLSFGPEADPALTEGVDLCEAARRWNDGLLPDLVTSRGGAQEAVIEALRQHLLELREQQVAGFRFKELIDPLKEDVRLRWAALMESEEGETALEDSDRELREVVRLIHPETRIEDWDSFEKLVDCVVDQLEQLGVSGRTHRYLTTLWSFLRTYASAGEVRNAEDEPPVSELPSRRKLAELLRIPRDRFGELYDILSGLAKKCLAAISGKPAVNSKGGSASKGKQGTGET